MNLLIRGQKVFKTNSQVNIFRRLGGDGGVR